MKALANSENPWLGLVAYGEDDNGYFFGRTREEDELLRLVEDDVLVVLYGVSGLGKTSLLQAGVVPKLREKNFLPVVIRLTHGDSNLSLGPMALAAVTEAAGKSDSNDSESGILWEYFHRNGTQFWSARQQLLTPVLIFDQFEEIFTLGRATDERRLRSEQFLKELESLIYNRPPADFQRRIENSEIDPDDYNFDPIPVRVVISLREDFLPQLSEYRQRGFPTLLRSALRLRPLSLEAALECIERPAPHLLEPGVADRLVKFLAGAGESTEHSAPLNGSTGSEPIGTPSTIEKGKYIESALLSVVCRELNNERQRRGLDRIDDSLLKLSQEQILTDFYERSFEAINPALRNFVERELVSPGGYRDSRALDDAVSRPGVERSDIDRLIDRRLLHYQDREDGQRRIELTHDVLTGIASRSRDLRRERESEELRRQAEIREQMTHRRLRRTYYLLAAMGVLLVGAITAFIWALTERDHAVASDKRAHEAEQHANGLANEANKMRDEAETGRREAYQLLIGQAFSAWQRGQIGEARKLLEDPAIAVHPNDTEVREWEWRYVEGLCKTTEARHYHALTGHTETITAIVSIKRGPQKTVASAGADATIRVWDVATGHQIASLEEHKPSIGLGFIYEHDDKEKTYKITHIYSKSPAARDGRIKKRDLIVGFVGLDGSVQNATELTPQQTAERLHGESGSQIKIQIQHPQNKSIETVELTRGEFDSGRRHESAIVQIATSATGKQLASIDSEGRLIAWNLETNMPTDLLDLDRNVLDIAFSPSGLYIACCFQDGLDLRYVKVGSVPLPKRGAPQEKPIVAFAFSPTNQIAVATSDGAIHFQNAENGTEIQKITLDGNTKISQLEYSPNGQILAVRLGTQIRLFNTRNFSEAPRVLYDSSYPKKFTFHPTGNYIATADSDGLVRLWNVQTLNASRTLQGHNAPVETVTFLDDDTLASGSSDNSVRIWSLRAVEPSSNRDFDCESYEATGTCFSADQRYLVIADPWAKRLVVFDTLIGIKVRMIPSEIFRTDFLASTSLIAVSDDKFTIRLYDAVTGKAKEDAPIFARHDSAVRGAAFSADGKRMISGDINGNVYLWNVSDANSVRLPGSDDQIGSVAMSPDGRWAAASIPNYRTIFIYDVASQKLAFQLQQSTDGYILRFTPDSQFLLVDDNQARLHLINLETHQDEHIFAGHHGLVWDTSFTPDSRRLATVGQDHTIRVWDTQAGREILRFDEKSLPTAVAFSPDGLRLVTVSSNHVHFWDAALFATTPDKPNWLFYGVRGNYLSGIEDWPEAIKDYTQSLALGGDAGYLRLKRGYANAALGNSAAAEDDLKSALSVDPTNPSTIEDLYSLLLGEGRLPECRTITAQYEDLASKQSNNETTNTAGWLFSLTPTDDSHAEELVKSMRSAVEHSPDDYDLRSTLGSLLYRSGKYQDAISTLRKGMDLKKLNANETAEGASIDHDQDGTALDWVFLAMSYCKLHDIPNAKKWLQQVSDKIERINHDPMYEDPNWNWQWDQATQLKALYDEATTLVEHSSL